MGGRVVVERGLLGDGGDDAASRAGRQASALGVEEERRLTGNIYFTPFARTV